MVTLDSEGMANDIGVELFCSNDTGEQFTFYVGIVLLQRHKSLGSKGKLATPRPFWDALTWTVTGLQTSKNHSVVFLQTIDLTFSNAS